jgi:hypothetical protein
MNKLLTAGLVLLAVTAAAARPVEGERPVPERTAPVRPRVAPGPAVPHPLHSGWVSADALWLIHVDVGGFKGSTIGRYVLDHPCEFDLSGLDEFEEEVGLSLLDDVMSVTLYGFSDEPDTDGVIIAVTTGRADEALARLQENPEVRMREIERDGSLLYAIDADGEQFYLNVRRADRRDRRLVVLAHSEAALLDALRVIDGRAPGLVAGRSAVLNGGPGPGSIVFVGASGGELLGHQPGSEILRLSDGVTIDVGERDGMAYAEGRIFADSPEKAADIADVLHGILAMGRLLAAEEPEAQPLAGLADAVDVTIRDRKINVRISYDAERLLGILDELNEL